MTDSKKPPRIFAVIAVMLLLSMVALLIGRWQTDIQSAGKISNLAVTQVDLKPGGKNSGVMIVNELPEFALIDQDAKPYLSQQLAGKVWVANFIFTSCKAMCPMLTHQMKMLQKQLEEQKLDATQLVSFSVDPNNDRPDVLKRYASDQNTDLTNWTFLTGERAQIYSLSKSGFKLAVTDDPTNKDMPILHTNMFALVDQDRVLRGFYDPSTETGRQRLMIDIQRVTSERDVALHQTQSGTR